MLLIMVIINKIINYFILLQNLFLYNLNVINIMVDLKISVMKLYRQNVLIIIEKCLDKLIYQIHIENVIIK
jgi:hypothetical protein